MPRFWKICISSIPEKEYYSPVFDRKLRAENNISYQIELFRKSISARASFRSEKREYIIKVLENHEVIKKEVDDRFSLILTTEETRESWWAKIRRFFCIPFRCCQRHKSD